MVNRCVFGRSFMQWIIAFLMAVDWKFVPPQVLRMIARTFRGWLASLHNEDAHKRLKDTVMRESPSLLVGNIRLWLELLDCGLIEANKRTPIANDCNAPPPTAAAFEKLFRTSAPTTDKLDATQRTEADRRLEWMKKNDSMKSIKFHTYNPGAPT